MDMHCCYREEEENIVDLAANGMACGFCREEPAAFRYRTVAVELPTPDGGSFGDKEADWNVCAVCAELVEARRWPDLAERVYAVRAADIPPELRGRYREAARQSVDLFGSAALAPRRPLVEMGGSLAPLPTPQEVTAFAASLTGDDEEDEDGPELADWDWIETEIERARAAGEIQADWVIESE